MIAQIDKVYKKYTVVVLRRLASYFLFEGRPLTTKGRFINPFVKFMIKSIFMIPKLKSPKIVYIIGTGRSGTTMLGKCLSTISKSTFLNEPKLFWNLIDDEDDLNCNYTDKCGRYRFDEKDWTSEKSKRVQRFYSFYSLVTSTNLIIDKYPEMAFRVSYLNSLLGGELYLFLIRNGFNSVFSIEGWSKKHSIVNTEQSDIEDWWGLNDSKWNAIVDELVKDHPILGKNYLSLKFDKRHKVRAAVEWVLTMEQIERLQLSPQSSKVMVVNYELFVQNADIRKKVASFITSNNTDRYLEYCNEALVDRCLYSDKELSLPTELCHLFNQMQIKLGYSEMATVESQIDESLNGQSQYTKISVDD